MHIILRRVRGYAKKYLIYILTFPTRLSFTQTIGMPEFCLIRSVFRADGGVQQSRARAVVRAQ